MIKHCKILATVGPASSTVEKLESMIRAGVNLFRLNFSHGTYSEHEVLLQNIKEAEKRVGYCVGVLQDISGPKVRIGELKESVKLEIGDIVEFVRDDIIGTFIKPHRLRLTLNRPQLLDKLCVGDLVYMSDGAIGVRVVSIKESIVTEVISGGYLSSHKGVNFPGTRLDIDVLTPKDRDDIAWGVEHDVDFMAISFVQKASDMTQVKNYVNSLGGKQHLIAKIEKFDAVENFDEILQKSDGIMVARGDLGIEIPYYRVPEVQKEIIRKANLASKPVITATQMLFSMTKAERATRAEISDVANAVLDGSDCLMLSEETAVGKYPLKAVETMALTITEAEKIFPHDKFTSLPPTDESDVVNESVVMLANNITASAILSLTTSSLSARKLARYRPKKPIYAITYDIKVSRWLTLSWGVVPAFRTSQNSLQDIFTEVIKDGIDRAILNMEESYVLTASYPVGTPGAINLIRVLKKSELSHYFLKAES